MRGSRRNHTPGGGRTAGCGATASSSAASSDGSRRRGGRAPPCTRSPGAAVRDRPPRAGERPDLVDQAGVAHGVDPRLDAARRARRAAARRRPCGTGNDGGAVLPEAGTERRERLPGEPDHLERAHDAARVAGLDARRRVGIDALELGVRAPRGRPALAASASSSARTARSSPRERAGVDDRLHVQAGAADEQRALARAPRCRRPRRVPRPGTARPTSRRRVGDVDQVVRHRGPLGGRRLGGADVEAAVHLHRVDRDDLDVAERVRRRASASADLPDAVGPTSARCVSRGSAGRRPGCARARGAGAATSTSSPRSQCGAAPVIRDVARVPPARGRGVGREVHELVLAGAAGDHASGPSSTALRPAPPRCARRAPRAARARGARRRR